MQRGPGWLPSIDAQTVVSAIQNGLSKVIEVPGTADMGILTTVDPTTLVLGTVVSPLLGEKVVQYAGELDVRLQQYVEEHDDSNAQLARIAAGVCWLLPEGQKLNDAAIDAARGDPERFRELLTEYFEDDDRRKELDAAVDRILRGDFEDVEDELTEAFGTTDREAAQAVFLDFRDFLNSRQIQETLEKVLELQSQFTELKDELKATRKEVKENFQRIVNVDIENEGFERITPVLELDVRDYASPWRAGFKLRHVRAGLTIERFRDGRNVTDDLFEKLYVSGGSRRLVVGPAGSGKSTICLAVAWHWYDHPDAGPVFYRPSGSGIFESKGSLRRALEKCSGHPLVVVEDAVRLDAETIFEVIEKCEDRDIEASFLLDARAGELQTFEELGGPGDLETTMSSHLGSTFDNTPLCPVPEVDEDTCRRVVETFKRYNANKSVHHSPSHIYNHIQQTDADIGEMLYLAYFLPVRGEGGGLEEDVANKLQTIQNPKQEESQKSDLAEFDADLLQDVGIMVNILNATAIDIHPELVHALEYADDYGKDARGDIQEIQEAFEGWMLYPRDDDLPRGTHELWSTLFLRWLATKQSKRDSDNDDRRPNLSQRAPRARFIRCIEALFALVDDGDFRADLREDAFPNSDRLARIDKSPQKEIGDIALAIFDLWKEWPVLLSLYWSESAQISPPERCSEGARWAVTRRQGQALRNAGEYKPAQERFETNLEIIEQRDEPSTQRKLAMCFSDLGVVKQSQGEYDDAEEYYQRSHSIFSEIGDQARSAKIAVQIGDSMMMRGETAPARGHFENSLTTARRIGALETEAMGLAGLGGLLSREGIETTEAKDYLHQAKRISKKTNSRPALSKSELGSADFHHKCDSFPEAIEHAQRACDIAGEIGNQILQRWSTQILALVYFDSKNYKTSGKEFEKAAKISMSAGATTETLVALSFAVEAFTENGDHERAMENCHQALNLFEREDADLSRINDLDRSFFEGHRDRLLRVSDWDFNDERRNSMDIESASSVVISV